MQESQERKERIASEICVNNTSFLLSSLLPIISSSFLLLSPLLLSLPPVVQSVVPLHAKILDPCSLSPRRKTRQKRQESHIDIWRRRARSSCEEILSRENWSLWCSELLLPRAESTWKSPKIFSSFLFLYFSGKPNMLFWTLFRSPHQARSLHFLLFSFLLPSFVSVCWRPEQTDRGNSLDSLHVIEVETSIDNVHENMHTSAWRRDIKTYTEKVRQTYMRLRIDWWRDR